MWRWVRRGLLAVLAIGIAVQLWFLVRVILVRGLDPGRTAMMDERASEVDGLEIDQRWRPLDEISTNLVRAAIAGEDIRFMEHYGIDWSAVRAAAEENRRSGDVVRGGSTITQQLAKNLYLSSWQSYIRKAQEAVIAYELEAFVGKRRIMELYLNVIEWGDGIYGAEAAAQHYFKRSAASLTPWQAAHLAAIIPGPRKALNPKHNPKRHAAARQRILRAMKQVPSPKFD